MEVVWDECCLAALGVGFDTAKWREVRTLSGGEQKRLALEALLRGPDQVLLLDEPDNYLDVPGKLWLERSLLDSTKTVLLVSHDRELLARAVDRIITVELGAAGNTAWVHGGSFADYPQARADRFARLDELRRRWDEEHAKLKALVMMYKQKAAYNSDLASRYHAAQTRLRKFKQAGPPEKLPRKQNVRMRLRGSRSGKRAVVCENVALTGLMQPFDLEIWYGERVAVLGSNGSGKSHFLRLLAAGGSDPESAHRPVGDVTVLPVATAAVPGSAPGYVPAGSPRPTSVRSWRDAPCWRSCTGVTSTGPGCLARTPAGSSAATSWRTAQSRPSTRSPVGSKPASRSCCWNCPERTCSCSMSLPTISI
jgi:ATPase subunit of ABC transporter with duplicated ATPase domains